MSVLINGFELTDTDEWWDWVFTGKGARGNVDPDARADFFEELRQSAIATGSVSYESGHFYSSGAPFMYRTHGSTWAADTETRRLATSTSRPVWTYAGDDPAMTLDVGCCLRRGRLPDEPTCTRFYFTGNAQTQLTEDAAWDGGEYQGTYALSPTPTSTQTGGGASWDAVNAAAQDLYMYQFRYTLSGDLLSKIQAGGSVRVQMRASSRFGIGISEISQQHFLEACIRVYRPSTTSFVGTALAVGAATGATNFNNDNPSVATNRALVGTLAGVAGATTNDVLVVEIGARHVAPTSGGTGFAIYATDNAGSDLPEDESTTTNLNSWIDICA